MHGGVGMADLDIFLLSLCAAGSSHPDLTTDFVRLAAAALSRVLLERMGVMEGVSAVLGESEGTEREREQPLSLKDILGKC